MFKILNVVGPSGVGKTTLIVKALTIYKNQGGKAIYKDIRKLYENTGVIKKVYHVEQTDWGQYEKIKHKIGPRLNKSIQVAKEQDIPIVIEHSGFSGPINNVLANYKNNVHTLALASPCLAVLLDRAQQLGRNQKSVKELYSLYRNSSFDPKKWTVEDFLNLLK